MMFGLKKQESLSGPKNISRIVEKHLIDMYKWDPALMEIVSMVLQKIPKGEKTFNCRIYDISEVYAQELTVKDYSFFDEYPDLILYEGWFDESSKQIELTEKKRIDFDFPLFTEEEIIRKIEALDNNNNNVFFYQARGPAFGGPLGRGAAIIEFNPNHPEKKEKKYIIYTANVIGKDPVSNKQKLYSSDKPKEIARWVMNAYHKRMY